MKKLTAYAAAAALFVLPGCAASSVEVNHQGDARMPATLDTYAVVDHPVGSTPTTRHSFNAKIHPIMARKGYAQAPAKEADLFISFKSLWMHEGSPSLNFNATEMPATHVAILGMEEPAPDVQKVVLVMIEEARTDRVIWVGWTNAEVNRDRVNTSTSSSLDEILDRIPSRN